MAIAKNWALVETGKEIVGAGGTVQETTKRTISLHTTRAAAEHARKRLPAAQYDTTGVVHREKAG